MKKAKKSTRFSNLILDGCILWLLLWGMFELLVPLNLNFSMEDDFLDSFIFFIILFCYYYFFELVFNRTPAKFITTTKVISVDGTVPSKKQILLRSLSRLIPFESLSFLFGGNGWHDKFSDTLVIDL